jgi:hypothetical protein
VFSFTSKIPSYELWATSRLTAFSVRRSFKPCRLFVQCRNAVRFSVDNVLGLLWSLDGGHVGSWPRIPCSVAERSMGVKDGALASPIQKQITPSRIRLFFKLESQIFQMLSIGIHVKCDTTGTSTQQFRKFLCTLTTVLSSTSSPKLPSYVNPL